MVALAVRFYRKALSIAVLSKSLCFILDSALIRPFSIFSAGSLNTTIDAPHTGSQYRHGSILNYSSKPKKPLNRAYKQRVNRRLRLASKPVLDESSFERAASLLPPRFTADHLHDVIVHQDDPLVCFELFNRASLNPRFRHNVNSYHITIKKLGAAKMYEEMDAVVNRVLAVPHIGSEDLYNTMIYYYTEARKLTRSVVIFKHMKDCKNLACRPSIKTYNLLFAAFLSRRSDSYVNHAYMETMCCLFRQLVNDGIVPDIFTLNCLIKGYVLSNHVNDALRVFRQMGVAYCVQPNAVSYDCIVHGLCAQGRTRNASEIFGEMKNMGFVLSAKTYNSLVNALCLNGEVEEAIQCLREMTENKKRVDFITYRTVMDQLCRQGKAAEAKLLLEEFNGRDLVDGPSFKKLVAVLEDNFAPGRSYSR